MAEEAFNNGAVSDRELQTLEVEQLSREARIKEFAEYLNSFSPEEQAAIISMSTETMMPPEMRPVGSGSTSDMELKALNPGAFGGVTPGQQIGASPDNPGATRGLPPEESGINTFDQNSMMEYVQRKAAEIKSRMSGGQPDYSGSFENFLRSTQPREMQTIRGNQ